MAAHRSSLPRSWLAVAGLMGALALLTLPAARTWADDRLDPEVRAVMDAFMTAFNARDEAAWVDTLHYPHVRIASGHVAVYPNRAAMLDATDLATFGEEDEWDHSAWDDLRVIQTSPEKVHVAVNFTRYDAQGGVIGTYASLYVLEKLDGRWGVRARSSFAP
jgi:hypothetical protein